MGEEKVDWTEDGGQGAILGPRGSANVGGGSYPGKPFGQDSEGGGFFR